MIDKLKLFGQFWLIIAGTALAVLTLIMAIFMIGVTIFHSLGFYAVVVYIVLVASGIRAFILVADGY